MTSGTGDGPHVAEADAADAEERAGLLGVCLVAGVCAVAVGFIGGAFRWGLDQALDWRHDVADWAQATPGPTWLVPLAITTLGAGAARWLVTLSPNAAGSGVQELEGVWAEQLPPPRLRVLPIKFAGGLLALGTGLVLGREGPTVHMGSTVGASASRRLRLPPIDGRVLQAALGGAGLAVAFNAPIGGALFVFEEVARSFRPRLVMPTLIGSVVAVSCSRLVLGDAPDFLVQTPSIPPAEDLWLYVLFGVLIGALGAGYNNLVMLSLRLFDSLQGVTPVVRAMIVGAGVGVLLTIDPLAVGGGDTLVQDLLDGGSALTLLFGLVIVRFVAGPVSYAAGTPGGLFAPLLALGALTGALVDGVASALVPSFDGLGVALLIAGMAALFTAVVRAPLTGVVLVIEMTAAASVAVPVIAASFTAMLVATLLRSRPIYDQLKERAILDLAPSDPDLA